MTEQQPLFDVLQARDTALAQVEARAEDDEPGFVARACAFVLDYLARHGPTSGEALTDACLAAGIKPDELRAFGAVYMRLARGGKIVKAGTCVRRRGHGTAGGNVWSLPGNAS